MKVEVYKPSESLCRYGEDSNKAYCLLKGSVLILIPSDPHSYIKGKLINT